MLAYVAESAASAPPPRKGPPLIPPGRASLPAPGMARGAGQASPTAVEAGDAEEAMAAFMAGDGADTGDGPPIEDLEAQMGGEVAARDAAAPRRPERARAGAAEDDEEGPGGGKGGPLPELDDLVGRLPAEVRETVEELLRVRFVSVKKVPRQALGGDFQPGAGAA